MATATRTRPTGRYALSPAARDRLEAELTDLSTERAIRACDTPSMCGDVADIAEFAARDMLLEQLDERIGRIRDLLAESAVAGVSRRSRRAAPDTVSPGLRVSLRFDGADEVEEFVLGDRAEQVSGVAAITLSSPLGQALDGSRPGDEVEYSAPSGRHRATVVAVRAA